MALFESLDATSVIVGSFEISLCQLDLINVGLVRFSMNRIFHIIITNFTCLCFYSDWFLLLDQVMLNKSMLSLTI